MKTRNVILPSWVILGIWTTAGAQGRICEQVAATASMARAKSIPALLEAKRKAGDDYRAQVVFAYRAFQLRPKLRSNAERVLALIPKDEEQQNVLMTLGDSVCDGESGGDMTSLSDVNRGLARQLRRAVALVPEFLPAYVEYSLEAITDPHSDYAIEMKNVCEQLHARFVSAVQKLPGDKRTRLEKFVINTDTCRVLAVPEAEQ